jgi:TolB-like protein/class 3 adenylate cyclase
MAARFRRPRVRTRPELLSAGETAVTATRRLAAILAAHVAGYSRLMGADEEGTLERLKALRCELVDPKITEHHGRIVKTTGDGMLVEFASVVDAVRCAVAVQQAMLQRDTGVGADNRIDLRIGINLGDVIVEGDDLYGDGVNIAARIEALADAGGVLVSNMVHDHVRDRLPFVFEDLGEQQVKNIARPVRVYRVRTPLTHPVADAPGSPLSRSAGEGAERQRREAGEGSPPLPLPDKPSIAVLPFGNMSGDPEQEYFADGMVEEIIIALSRIRWLFVIARNSSFTYKGQAVDVKQVGSELGVRYVLEGSVRKAGGRVRITAQLIDALTGTHLWADRFDGSLEDVFDLQEKVALSVAGIMEPALQAAETGRSAHRPTNDLTAYDLYLRAYAMFFSSATQIPEALRLMEQAIERDPRYGPALSWAAVCCMRLCDDGRSEDPQADGRKGADFARRALQVAGHDPGTLANAALALAYFGEDIGAMIALVDRAAVLNPSFARGSYISSILRLWAGEPDLAIERARASLRLSPRGRFGSPFWVIGTAYLLSRRFDEALATLLVVVQQIPYFPMLHRTLASCYAHMGRLDEAREVISRLRAITPVVLPGVIPFRNPEDRELFLSGLRLAMRGTT